MSKFVVNPDEYIFFEPDQVLTNDHLNQLFGYLDQQERWTRNKLIGMGITCGLDLVYDKAKATISISGGNGITSQGYLISKCSYDTYTHAIHYTPKPIPKDLPFTCKTTPFFKSDKYKSNSKIYQLLDTAGVTGKKPDPCAECQPGTDKPVVDQNPPILLSSIPLAEYVVVLFLEVQEKDLKNCDTQDCNNKGEKIIFNLIPLLVEKRLIGGKNGDLPAKPKEVKLKRYNVPFKKLIDTSEVLKAFSALLDIDTLSRVEGALSYCFEYTAALFSNIEKLPFDNTGAYLHKRMAELVKQDPLLIQYCYDFINDLILAYYEFREATDCLDVACCADECLFPLHLVLGGATTTTGKNGKDPYRQYFIKTAGGCSCDSGELSHAEFLLKRIELMIKLFYDPFTKWEETLEQDAFERERSRLPLVKITPSQYEMFPLSDRAIPYYYNMDDGTNNLYEYWNYHKSANGNAAFNLSYNADVYNGDDAVLDPLLYDIEKYNFFRVEGHIGQPFGRMRDEILTLRREYNLPIDVVAISADALHPEGKLPSCKTQDLETDYKLLVNEFACRVHKPFCCLVNIGNKADQTELPEFEPIAFPFFGSAYKKGDFMRAYCDPDPRSLGGDYLKIIKKGGNVLQEVDDSSDYLDIFYFIDAVENLMMVFGKATLSDLSISNFLNAYKTYLRALERLISYFDDGGEDVKRVSDQLPCMRNIADELNALLAYCFIDLIYVLKREYANRVKGYESQQNFLQYFKKNPGLEHKAGVPKGGTFVLVYHGEESDQLQTNPGTFNHVAAFDTKADVPASDIVLTKESFNTLRKFLEKREAPTEEERTGMLKLLTPEPKERLDIRPGVVIADFYIPYLCCSDCVEEFHEIKQLPPPPPKPVDYKVTGGGAYCDKPGGGATGRLVGLSGSDTGVSYQLYLETDSGVITAIGGPVGGSGTSFDFGSETGVGTYSVKIAENTSGSINTVSGTVTITATSLSRNISLIGHANQQGLITIGIQDSEPGVSYQLLFGDTNPLPVPGVNPVIGTGSPNAVFFSPGQTTPGTYRVEGTSADGVCTTLMDASVDVGDNPLK